MMNHLFIYPLIFISLLCSLVSASSVDALAAEPRPRGRLVFSSDNFEPYSNASLTGFEDLMTKEIFRRLGYSVAIQRLPGARSLVSLNDGNEDGTLSRIGGLAKAYPNIVQFSEIIIVDDYVAFSRTRLVPAPGWESLSTVNVAFINGWKIFERNVKSAKSITKVGGLHQLFRLLEEGRTDVVLTLRWAGLQKSKELGISDVYVSEPPLATRDKFLYLHKRHKVLVSKASGALRDMKRDGTYQHIFDRTMGKLTSSMARAK